MTLPRDSEWHLPWIYRNYLSAERWTVAGCRACLQIAYYLFCGNFAPNEIEIFVLNYVTSQTRPNFGLRMQLMGRFSFKSKSKQKKKKPQIYSSIGATINCLLLCTAALLPQNDLVSISTLSLQSCVETIIQESRDLEHLPICTYSSLYFELKDTLHFSIEFGKSIKCTHLVHSYHF